MYYCVCGKVKGQFVGVCPLYHLSSWHQTHVFEFGDKTRFSLDFRRSAPAEDYELSINHPAGPYFCVFLNAYFTLFCLRMLRGKDIFCRGEHSMGFVDYIPVAAGENVGMAVA